MLFLIAYILQSHYYTNLILDYERSNQTIILNPIAGLRSK